MKYGTSWHYSYGYLRTSCTPPLRGSFLNPSLIEYGFYLVDGYDYEYPDEMPIANECSNISALILAIAFVWLLAYYWVFLPLNLIYTSKASLLEYDDGQLRPRCSTFRNFRQYENLHMLFWISKDLAWNRLNLSLWLVCLFPTIFISADLFIIALTSNSTVRTRACNVSSPTL
jgi:hypothetical protein